MFGSDVSNMVVTTTYVVFNDHLDIVSMLPVDSRDKEAAVKAAPPEARTGYFCDHTKIVTEVDGIKMQNVVARRSLTFCQFRQTVRPLNADTKVEIDRIAKKRK